MIICSYNSLFFYLFNPIADWPRESSVVDGGAEYCVSGEQLEFREVETDTVVDDAVCFAAANESVVHCVWRVEGVVDSFGFTGDCTVFFDEPVEVVVAECDESDWLFWVLVGLGDDEEAFLGFTGGEDAHGFANIPHFRMVEGDATVFTCYSSVHDASGEDGDTVDGVSCGADLACVGDFVGGDDVGDGDVGAKEGEEGCCEGGGYVFVHDCSFG